MGVRIAVLGGILLVACSSVDPSPNVGTAPATTEATIPRAAVERDLVLELTRTSTEAMDHERNPEIEVWLVNKSARASYPIVLANDGSEVGWREPHAFFTTELQRPSGAWEPMPVSESIRCGNYAYDWQSDVVTLAPGGRVKMKWMPYSGDEFGDATRLRVTAHYDYGAHARDKSKVPPELHPMPSYALTSAPLEIPVEHPYRLTLTMKGPLPATAETSIASALDLVVENRSQRPLPLATPESGAQLSFEVKLANEPNAETLSVESGGDGVPNRTLAPGARAALVSLATKTSTLWSLPHGKIVRIRALWRVWDQTTGQNGRRIESAWVDVP